VRTIINFVDDRASLLQSAGHSLMYVFQVGFGQKAFRDRALIGDDNYRKIRPIQQSDGFGHSRKNVKIFPASDVQTFGGRFIDDAVTVQENSSLQSVRPLLPTCDPISDASVAA
jgi:hypothetical protein